MLDFADLHDTRRRTQYVNDNLEYVLERDRRERAEWYLTENEARIGKQTEV